MSDRKWEIYTLSDPQSGTVRYVGVSHIGRKRYNRHIAEAKRGIVTHRHDWIRSVLATGALPAYSIVETGTGPGWAASESRWIEHYRCAGCDLTNLTDGGEGNPGYIPGPETRAKMAAAKLGKPRSAETRAKISAYLRTRTHTAEQIAKASAKRKGQKRTAEARAKMSAAKIGKPWSALRRALQEKKQNKRESGVPRSLFLPF